MGSRRWLKVLKGGLLLMLLCTGGCGHGKPQAVSKSRKPAPWPADAVFQAYPVIHCISEGVPPAFLTDAQKNGKEAAVAREVYGDTRDLVLTTLNLFLATGRWAGDRAHIKPTREPPRVGTPPECRMFELALAEQISVDLPPSVSGAAYIAPIAMVGYDYEPAAEAGKAPRITVRIAALLASGGGHVLRTLSALASTNYAETSPAYQERSSQEIAQDLTEALFRNLASAVSE